MSDGTGIEWSEATWNPITGCSVVSPGCTNCYAMRWAGTRMRSHPSRAGLTVDSKAGPVWTGEVRFNEKWLDQPLRWRRPRRTFVCAHGDLFHENVTDEWIDKVFAVMALAPQHVFQVLTKRPERMRAYVSSFRLSPLGWLTRNGAEPTSYGGTARHDIMPNERLPLPNVWLGVSVEDQKRADERIPDLLATPAAVRWISAEPLLGPVDLSSFLSPGSKYHFDPNHHWVVAGGESGPGARPMHPDWARSLRDQCAAAGVAFFFKQWGDWAPTHIGAGTHWLNRSGGLHRGLVPANACAVARIGKKAAGRLLDGVQHDGYPA